MRWGVQVSRRRNDLKTCIAAIQASQARAAELEAELHVLKEDLVRVGAVASRVAASEVRSGALGIEGMVPVSTHLDEVSFRLLLAFGCLFPDGCRSGS